jgi:rfaE bifunctional protein nucleotidyltransferase chain/domain
VTKHEFRADRRSPTSGRRRTDDEHDIRDARSKIRSIDDLAAIAAGARTKGQKVVLAHGVFDLIHLGHVRHLEAARRHGDVLMVTVTSDRHVNKGPGRPAFADQFRAEVLAAMEYVDWVGINDAPDAIGLLNKIKPDAYAKGADYADAAADVTGKIALERHAVESHGGKVVLTDELTSSSTKLLNRYMNLLDPALREYIDRHRDAIGYEAMQALIEKVRNFKVLLVGDAIVDEYQYVVPLGKSPKENMIATLFKDRELFAGGVIAAANHVANFCSEVDVITCVGGSDSQEELLFRSRRPNVDLHLIERPGVPTTRKCRFVETSYMRKLFEIYHMDDTPLDEGLENELNAAIDRRVGDYDLVIVTDFGHGLIGPSTIAKLVENSKFLAVNAQSNSANLGFNLVTKYPRADYVCIDAPEARLATHDKYAPVDRIVSEKLPAMVACERLIVTHGGIGCYTYSRNEGVHQIPAVTRTVVDTVGAGDAFLSVTSPLVAAGGTMQMVGFIGNVVGALKVGIVGHRSSIDKVSVLKSLKALLQ